jgi:hypothetical protein
MKLAFAASGLALTLASSGAFAADVNAGIFSGLADAAPRSVFDQLSESAPRSPFDGIADSAPRSALDTLKDSAPRSDGPFGSIGDNAP